MATEKILIIDETMEQVKPDYDLLQDTSVNMEDLIEIKEKKLPGKKLSFNHRQNAETKEVFVTGLVLNFSQDLADSQLKSILGRIDIEYLHLYADTIVINDRLVFPQANVTICCRQLVMEEQGFVCTTPENHPQPYAVGSGGDERKAGANGEPGGDITLLCQAIDNRHKKDEPIFILTGGKGQNGERGAQKNRPAKSGFPLSFGDVENAVISNDPIEGKTSNWHWPGFNGIDKKKLYFVELHSINMWWSAKNPRKLDKDFGDKNLDNQDNGADAIASGDGGNGGTGGKISFIDFKTTGRKIEWDAGGGEEGKSELMKGGKKAQDSTYYHLYLRVYHDDANYNLNRKHNKSIEPQGYYTKSLQSRDGYDAKGNDGNRGANGSKGSLPAIKYHWLHPSLLGTMLAYAKTSFRDGERWKAKWILDRYSEAAQSMPAKLKEEMQTASLIREVELNLRKLEQNLDFYGYPPGWVPKLSVLSNLNILIDSRRDLAQLLYFTNSLLKKDEANKLESKDLDWTVTELKKGVKAAQADLVAAYDEIPLVKDQIAAIEAQVRNRLQELRDLKALIVKEVKEQEQAQALFSGSFEILAAVCVMVPVGQPYLGQLGGGVMKQIAKIDINAENPLKEGLSFAGNLSGEIGSFVEKNKGKISTALNSGLTKEIESGTKDLNSFSSQIDTMSAELQEAERELKGRFAEQELAILTQKIMVTQSIRSSNRGSMSAKSDYADIIASIDAMEGLISQSRDLTDRQRDTLQIKLGALKADKKELAAKLKARKAEKEKREKNIDKAATAVKGLTDGISGISSGLQKMMVEFDENDPEVHAKMEKIKQSKYKKEFESINDKVAELNKRKLPLIEKLMRLEQRISESVQRINANMSQWSLMNDQRVMAVQYGLLPETRATLKRIMQDSWDLLMLECYYMTKSYQYRFLKKINPMQHGVQRMIEDIQKFSEGKDPGSMDATAFQTLFNNVLKSQFKRLAIDLLVAKQTTDSVKNEYSVPVIKADEKNGKGEVILDRLNTYRQASFRLEDIRSSKHGTNSWFNYRITGITFQRIVVEVDDKDANVSFDFGIRHSGDSVIRSGADNHLYYFTSRTTAPKAAKLKAAKNAPPLNLQVQSWNGAYNGADREKPNKGLSNSTDSHEDDQVLEKLLSDFDIKKEYNDAGKPYKNHYPGGTSELTLMIYDDSEQLNFRIKELEFRVDYEVLR